MNIEKQGAVEVNNAAYYEHTDIATVIVDTKTKWPVIDATGSDDTVPTICLSTGALNEEMTILSFYQYKGFEIFCATAGKYTIRICFIKTKQNG